MIANIILGWFVPVLLFIGGFYLLKVYRDDTVIKWVKIAVKAAEQIYNAQGQGKEKFDYVANWISKKFEIPKEELKNLIESAVYEINKEQK